VKIVLAGGSGHLGTLLAREFHDMGHDVLVLSRDPRPAAWRVARWDAVTLGSWAAEVDGSDVVIGLAGRSVNCRYTPANRRAILDSRVLSTRVVGEAIARAGRPPRVWLQMSSAAIYAHRRDAGNDEITGRIGGSEPDIPRAWSFSVGVVKAWEAALFSAATPRTRRVALRSSIVMGVERGGIFDVLLGLVRHGLGGTAGDGRQMVSWIHERDFARVVHWLIEREDTAGVVNVTSPRAVSNAEFMRALRRAWGTSIGLTATAWMLAIGARLLGTEPELVLKSRWSVPRRLLESGFRFQWTRWEDAARDLCDRWRSGAAASDDVARRPGPASAAAGAEHERRSG
jgi:uncharacterized protein